MKAQALVGDPLVGLQGSFSSELSSFHLSVVDCQFPAKDQDRFESVPHRVNRGGRGKELGSNSGSWKSLWSLIESYKENRCCTFSIVFVLNRYDRFYSSFTSSSLRRLLLHTIVVIIIMKYALAGAALLFSSVLATPAPLIHLFVRDPDTTNNIPDKNKNCNGNNYTPDGIKTAVNFAWQAIKDGQNYSMSSC